MSRPPSQPIRIPAAKLAALCATPLSMRMHRAARAHLSRLAELPEF
jgi:hypothetical protein